MDCIGRLVVRPLALVRGCDQAPASSVTKPQILGVLAEKSAYLTSDSSPTAPVHFGSFLWPISSNSMSLPLHSKLISNISFLRNSHVA
jgi:hypothetical protein